MPKPSRRGRGRRSYRELRRFIRQLKMTGVNIRKALALVKKWSLEFHLEWTKKLLGTTTDHFLRMVLLIFGDTKNENKNPFLESADAVYRIIRSKWRYNFRFGDVSLFLGDCLKSFELGYVGASMELSHYYHYHYIEYDKMSYYYTQLAEISPIGYNNMGHYWFKKGDYDKMFLYYREGIKKFKCSNCCNNIGWYYETIEGDFVKAIRYYKESLKNMQERDWIDPINDDGICALKNMARLSLKGLYIRLYGDILRPIPFKDLDDTHTNQLITYFYHLRSLRYLKFPQIEEALDTIEKDFGLKSPPFKERLMAKVWHPDSLMQAYWDGCTNLDIDETVEIPPDRVFEVDKERDASFLERYKEEVRTDNYMDMMRRLTLGYISSACISSACISSSE